MTIHLNGVKKIIVIAAVACAFWGLVISVRATSISEVQDKINKTQNQINEINSKIGSLEDEQDIVEEKIADLNAEILNAMTEIGVMEDAIAEKETEIAGKEVEIGKTEDEYLVAQDTEAKQYADMTARLRLMYENGDFSLLAGLMTGDGIADAMNQADYMEGIHDYDRKKLEEFKETRQLVLDLWNSLEFERNNLKDQKEQLESDKAELESLKAKLDSDLEVKKKQSANFEAEIKKARQEAAVAKKQLQTEQQQLKALQAAQNQGKTAAATGSYTTTNYTSVIDNAGGSDMGKRVAKYACQFIGNPYVSGGTSLTNGADCSGFTYRVYSDFGYSIPRTSTQQRSAGTGVSYAEAQPGDILCYEGHVALYIGGGLIVHASTQKTGIKITNAQYRPIITVRRIVN
ncbi:MAG: C40 family peptidase [Lachnospiraceae bacterium]|nr:C40 family peptidase [Lachnospiraceae bacterium]